MKIVSHIYSISFEIKKEMNIFKYNKEIEAIYKIQQNFSIAQLSFFFFLSNFRFLLFMPIPRRKKKQFKKDKLTSEIIYFGFSSSNCLVYIWFLGF